MIRRLVLFAKPPLPGRAKMRLAEEIGPAGAARIAEAMLRDTIATCERFGEGGECHPPRLVLAYTESPDWFTPALSADWRLIEQRGGDLGERIHNALDDLDVGPEDETVFIGMDCPQMPPQRIAEAFEALEEHDTVLGPCEDGGYYLIGVRGRFPGGALLGVRWSTAQALDDMIAGLEGLGLTIAHLVPGYDVDTAADLNRIAREIAADALDGVANLTKTLADLGM